MKRLSMFIAMLLTCSLLTGCWDKVEIEQRLFVLALGVDKIEDEEKSLPKDRYLVSFVSPIVGALQEGGGESTYHTYKTTGEIFTICLNNLYSRFAKRLSFEHTRTIVFGEELLKEEGIFKEVLDAMGRSHELHKSMYVFVVPGRAEEVFEIKPKYEKLLAMYVTGIADNQRYSDRISKQAAYEMYNELLNSNGNTLIPRLIPSKDEVTIKGVGIIKNYKLIGYLDGEEYLPVNWLRNKANSGLIEIYHKGIAVPFRYNEFKTNIKLDRVQDTKIQLTYSMETEGSVLEYIWDKDMLEEEVILTLEKELEKKIEEETNRAIKRFKEEFGVDLIGVRDYLSKYQPDIYEAVEKDYDIRFVRDIEINVTADVKVRRVGIIE
ncbi:MAG: Ger(x)C family spore germination protein [Bacillota bacterium]